MQKFALLIFLLSVSLGDFLFAQRPSAVLGRGPGVANRMKPFIQSGHRLLHRDTTYVLTGWYFVDSLASLTIQPGTLIVGDTASAATLIIRRGGKINANGTASQPIVFTSSAPAGRRKIGDWGGIIILGSAPTNKPTTTQIEGGFGVEPGTDAMYGGANPDDSSGVLRYVRIEFPGIAYSQDNEINGLTFGGVGRKTVVEYIQVSYCGDDDYEFFGGNVDAKYLVSWINVDDNFDTDHGYSGRLQFLYVKRDSTIFDASAPGQSNGFESDNEGRSPYAALPRTSARVSNVTLIGPQSDTSSTISGKWGHLAMIRRASEFSIYNSILVGYPMGIELRDTLTQRAAIDGRLEIRNTSIQSRTRTLGLSSSPSTGNIAGFDIAAWFNRPEFANRGSTPRRASDVGFTPAAFSFDPKIHNPIPTAGSEGATAPAAFNVGRLSGDTWFTPVTYRGAFDPSKPMSAQWTAGWTNFDPVHTDYSRGVTNVEQVSTLIPTEFVLEQNYPNPFNPTTTIRYSLAKAERVHLAVYDLLGQEVTILVDGHQQAGEYSTLFNATGLTSGVYFYKLSTGSGVQVRKMLLLQ
jgi:hypothetical protein